MQILWSERGSWSGRCFIRLGNCEFRWIFNASTHSTVELLLWCCVTKIMVKVKSNIRLYHRKQIDLFGKVWILVRFNWQELFKWESRVFRLVETQPFETKRTEFFFKGKWNCVYKLCCSDCRVKFFSWKTEKLRQTHTYSCCFTREFPLCHSLWANSAKYMCKRKVNIMLPHRYCAHRVINSHQLYRWIFMLLNPKLTKNGN